MRPAAKARRRRNTRGISSLSNVGGRDERWPIGPIRGLEAPYMQQTVMGPVGVADPVTAGLWGAQLP